MNGTTREFELWRMLRGMGWRPIPSLITGSSWEGGSRALSPLKSFEDDLRQPCLVLNSRQPALDTPEWRN